jgi:hypothetical protein
MTAQDRSHLCVQCSHARQLLCDLLSFQMTLMVSPYVCSYHPYVTC